MANRYTNLTPSAYTPLTLEEIAMVPAMRRKQHDAVLAQQELIRSGLAKVDPLSVHYDKALALKKGLEGKMDATATELASQGINPDMIGKTIALNREVQDLISPMGDIGKINAAKVEYNKQKEDFIKSAEAQKIGRDRALKLWGEKTKDYTGFDPEGKVSNVTAQGVAAFQNYGEDLSRAHALLGKTVKGVTSSGHHLEPDGQGNFWEVTRNGERVKSDNAKQVEAAYKSFRDKWMAASGEGTAYARDAGLGIDENRILNDFNSMLETSDISKSTESANYNLAPKEDDGSGGKGKKEPGIPTGILDPNSVAAVAKEDFNKIDFSQIGKRKVGMSSSLATSTTGLRGRGSDYSPSEISGRKTYKDILTPLQQKAYEVSFKRLKANNKIPKDAKITDTDIVPKIQTYMTRSMKIPTVGNDVIMPNISPNAQMFMGELAGTAPQDMDLAVFRDIRSGYRQVIDPTTNMPLKKSDWEVGGKAEDWKVQYIGYDSPVNYRGTKHGNAMEQSVMPHRVLITDKDGRAIGETTVSRSRQELKRPEFKKAYEINHIYKNAVENFGDWVTATGNYSGSKNIRGVQVKQNDDGTFLLRKGNIVSDPLTAGEYANELNDIMSDINQE